MRWLMGFNSEFLVNLCFFQDFLQGKCFNCGKYGEHCIPFGLHGRKHYEKFWRHKKDTHVQYLITSDRSPYCSSYNCPILKRFYSDFQLSFRRALFNQSPSVEQWRKSSTWRRNRSINVLHPQYERRKGPQDGTVRIYQRLPRTGRFLRKCRRWRWNQPNSRCWSRVEIQCEHFQSAHMAIIDHTEDLFKENRCEIVGITRNGHHMPERRPSLN